MSETRKIFCKSDPTEVLAEVTFPDGTSEIMWTKALEGYLCTAHDAIPVPLISLDDKIANLQNKLDSIKIDVEDLKKKIP